MEKIIDDTDANALSMFMQNDVSQRRTIADIVMEKIKEFEEKSQQPVQKPTSLHPKVVQVYKGFVSKQHQISSFRKKNLIRKK